MPPPAPPSPPTPPPPLPPPPSSTINAGEAGHSYTHNGLTGGASKTSNPQIRINQASFMGLYATYNPLVRFEVWQTLSYSTLSKSGNWTAGGGSGTPTIGGTVTQGSNSDNVLASAPGKVTCGKTRTADFTTAAVAFSSGESATSVTTAVNVNSAGYGMGLQGDTIGALSGNIGVTARLSADLPGLPRQCNLLALVMPVNSLINGVSAATCRTQTKTAYDAAVSNCAAGALIPIVDCDPFQVTSGFNTYATRRAIADYNIGLRTDVTSYSGYAGDTVRIINCMSAMLKNATGNVTTDNNLFADGTGGALCTISGDTLTIVSGKTGANPAVGDIICGPGASTIVPGTTILAPIVAGTSYQLSTSNTVGSNTQFQWGLLFGDPAKMVDTLHWAQGGIYPMLEDLDTWVQAKLGTGDWWETAYSAAVNSVTTPNQNFSGTGVVAGAGASGSCPAGITCTASGGNGTAGTWVVSTEDGTGVYAGKKVLVIDYHNDGTSIGDKLQIALNTVTGGVFLNTFVGWAQFRVNYSHDDTGILQNVQCQMGLAANQKTICSDGATTQSMSIGLPLVARMRRLLTPAFELGTDNVPAGNGKPQVNLTGPASPALTARVGTQRVKIYPDLKVCQVANPKV